MNEGQYWSAVSEGINWDEPNQDDIATIIALVPRTLSYYPMLSYVRGYGPKRSDVIEGLLPGDELYLSGSQPELHFTKDFRQDLGASTASTYSQEWFWYFIGGRIERLILPYLRATVYKVSPPSLSREATLRAMLETGVVDFSKMASSIRSALTAHATTSSVYDASGNCDADLGVTGLSPVRSVVEGNSDLNLILSQMAT